MLRSHACEVGHLMPAGDAARDEHLIATEGTRRRQEPALPDRTGHLEMIVDVPEGAGHAAAAGIQIHDR